MHTSVILFSVVMSLSAISFIAAICMLLYYKRQNFEIQSEMTRVEFAKKLATVSAGIQVSVLISMAATAISAGVVLPLAALGVFIVLALCGVSIVIGPAVSLLGIVFSVISVKRDAEGKFKYIWACAISMAFSLCLLVAYIRMIAQ